MSKYIDKAIELRSNTGIHYNCGQSVILPFAEEIGLSEEKIMGIAGNFNLGLKNGAQCGAITAGIVVLGLMGISDPKTINSYYNEIKLNHDNMMNCSDLLRANAALGRERKPHCDELVYECVGLVEKMLKEKGLLK